MSVRARSESIQWMFPSGTVCQAAAAAVSQMVFGEAYLKEL